MLETERADTIFADAHVLYADALEELDRGNLRNAAEKAWGATKRATDALLLARTGREPRTSGQTSRGLRALRRQDPTIESLRLRYAVRQSFLHGACFYDGMCEPEEDLIADIRETADYISNAQDLAGELA
jgi:hypothetical protein